MQINSLKNLDLKHKRVFLRADLNVTIENNQILQNHRLREILPTINYIQKNGGKVILATHIGRPKASEITNYFDPELSTKIIADWFLNHKIDIKLKTDLLKAELASHENFGQILLLENLRFYNGEQGATEERERFAQILKNLADIYVNDAFALIHRDDTSVTLLPEKFRPENRAIGLLIEKEITELSRLKKNPEKPFLVILGGNKIKDKIEIIENFLNQPENTSPSAFLIGGALAYTFLYFQNPNINILKNLIEEKSLDFVKSFFDKAKNKNIKIFLPIDHMVEIDNNINYFENLNLPENSSPTDIGPKTIAIFTKQIKEARTIFVNGSMGIYTKENSNLGTKEILKAISLNKDCYKIAGGGDCVTAVNMFHSENGFSFLSTGGGATLAFLACKKLEDLPGLKSLV